MPVCYNTCSPTYESAFTITFFPINVPSPTLAVDEMIAEGSLITGNSNPICFNVSYIVSRIFPLLCDKFNPNNLLLFRYHNTLEVFHLF